MRVHAQKQSQPQQELSSDHILHKAGTEATNQSRQSSLDTHEMPNGTETLHQATHHFGKVTVFHKAPVKIQAKLMVNTPGDIYEQEADHISEQVMHLPEPQLQRACPCGGGCPKCQTEQPGHEYERLQTKHVGSSDSGQLAAPPTVHEVLASPGQPLDHATRAFMEPRFGHDFSQVRVHSGPAAEQSAEDVNAHAYTVGHDIVFGAGQFTPGTQEGRRLLAHELTHVAQQSGGERSPVNQSHAQRGLFPIAQERAKLVRINASPVTQRMLQRDIGFEFQTKNFIVGDKGRKFPRKFGKFLHKVPPTDKNGVELQTDTGSVAEFETFHFRKWSDLQVQIQNAVDVVQQIKKDPKAFPFNQETRLRSEGLLKKGEKLEVDIQDSTFTAAIQSTEGFALAQYESSLKEHERPGFVDPVIKRAQDIINDAQKASKISSTVKLDNLRGLLQVIINYIMNAQDRPSTDEKVSPVKARFRLMSRTSFSAMFNSVLSADEQKLFKEIVKSDAIPKALGLAGTDEFFPGGYWGHFGDLWALFQGGKVIALASEDKNTIHPCSSKKKTPGIDSSSCGTKVANTQITINEWLNSIVKQTKDALSPPPRGGSESMGKFDVQTKGQEKDLVVFETRGETNRNRNQPADKWVAYADEVFGQAAACRPRAGTGTELIYDGKNPFDPKKCP
ncbi:MAG: DUF4157 domain-containing protein [Pyrinomonadaceae bacterium]